MNPVREALEAKLKADAQLVGLLSGASKVIHRRPPGEKYTPFVIVDKQGGNDIYSFGGRVFVDQTWLVKGVDRGRTADRAEDIGRRIDAVLTDATLTLTSGTVLYCRRETDVDYDEASGDQQFWHVGGVFRIVTDS